MHSFPSNKQVAGLNKLTWYINKCLLTELDFISVSGDSVISFYKNASIISFFFSFREILNKICILFKKILFV